MCIDSYTFPSTRAHRRAYPSVSILVQLRPSRYHDCSYSFVFDTDLVQLRPSRYHDCYCSLIVDTCTQLVQLRPSLYHDCSSIFVLPTSSLPAQRPLAHRHRSVVTVHLASLPRFHIFSLPQLSSPSVTRSGAQLVRRRTDAVKHSPMLVFDTAVTTCTTAAIFDNSLISAVSQ